MSPKISVLLPVYNAEAFIAESIQSILDQTEPDFELLIIDDCSTDNSVSIIESFQDPRIILYKKKVNSGYTESLNWAIDQARGAYIARMDADDISLPQRFEKQIYFLEQNSHIAICGTDAVVEGSSLKFNYPTEPKAIQAHLLLGSSLIHPSIMGRTDLFKQFKYDPLKEPAEDYDLFTLLAAAGVQLANLNEPLLIYRVHSNQISKVQNQKQVVSAQQSMLRMFRLFDCDQMRYPNEVVLSYIWPTRVSSMEQLKAGLAFFEQLEKCKHPFSKKQVSKTLRVKRYNLLKACVQQKEFGTIKASFFALQHLGPSYWRQILKLSQ
ncbi:glycosyltransferase family 2 protein [Leeuwenhoekiella marinoflava]|uniref:Glycosyl transferase family 2 n=2 Tax=Leeuwenhoekiella marinoflava TaxID=988 RepID=A0A4Q0PIP4_9FLAO|nr:glycosyltransferase family 2 protein [Leeuwenhoekiella marinoflava]RXG26920.1 glycosyl transferase family 2 [Leeuwenhoekiella marinoflava]SHF41179.1 Glycosyl transferase family 2 [Leeuwenhoekiella marinoflava DSM 3653]